MTSGAFLTHCAWLRGWTAWASDAPRWTAWASNAQFLGGTLNSAGERVGADTKLGAQLDLHGQQLDEALAKLDAHLTRLGELCHPGGVLLQVPRAGHPFRACYGMSCICGVCSGRQPSACAEVA